MKHINLPDIIPGRNINIVCNIEFGKIAKTYIINKKKKHNNYINN